MGAGRWQREIGAPTLCLGQRPAQTRQTKIILLTCFICLNLRLLRSPGRARELLRSPKSAVPHFELFVRFREVRSKAKRYDTDRYRRSSGAASTDRPSPKPERRRPVGRGGASLVIPIFSRGRRLTLDSSEGQDRKSWIAPCVPT